MKLLIKLVFGFLLCVLVSFLMVACEGFKSPSGPEKYPPNRTEDSVDVSTCRFYAQPPGSAARFYRCADPEKIYDSVFYVTKDTL